MEILLWLRWKRTVHFRLCSSWCFLLDAHCLWK